ncbi:MAG: hypothetical protein U1G05_17295 [Kiritimatiellia bacterium]
MNAYARLADRLAAADPSACRVVAGFDGFVDEMITLVGERRGLDDFTPVPDIATFGRLVAAAAGHSSLREDHRHRHPPRRLRRKPRGRPGEPRGAG